MKASSPLRIKMRMQELFLRYAQYTFKHFDELERNADLFDDAKIMWFYAGELFSDFYNDTRKRGFVSALIKSIENGGKMCAVFGPALYVDNKEFLALALSRPEIELYKRPFRDPSHFKLLQRKDGKVSAIIDKDHPVTTDKDSRCSVMLSQGYEREIHFLIEKFKLLKEQSVKITLHNLFKEFEEPGVDEDGELTGFIAKSETLGARHASSKEIGCLKDYLVKRVPLKKLCLEELLP